jgi:uncharacterized membrane protein YeiH
VGAVVLGGVKLAINIEDGDLFIVHVAELTGAGGNI